MTSLGFENYAEALKIYLSKYREVRLFYTILYGVVSLVSFLFFTNSSSLSRIVETISRAVLAARASEPLGARVRPARLDSRPMPTSSLPRVGRTRPATCTARKPATMGLLAVKAGTRLALQFICPAPTLAEQPSPPLPPMTPKRLTKPSSFAQGKSPYVTKLEVMTEYEAA